MGAEGGDIKLIEVCTIILFYFILRIEVKLHRNDRVQTIAADDQRRNLSTVRLVGGYAFIGRDTLGNHLPPWAS